MFVYVENLKNPTVRFQVLSYDKESHEARLKGEYGAEFTQNISKEALAKRGYRIVKSEKALPLQSSAPPKEVKPKKGKADEDDE